MAIQSVEDSLRRMKLDVLDLVLVHWPNPSVGRYVEVFEALVECRERGLVRSIGTSNYTERHLREVIAATGVTPSINQIELHPSFPQEEMLAVHEELGIRTQAWSPLARMESLSGGLIDAAAQAHGVSATQVVLRWHVERGVLPLPKSSQVERQRANLDIFDEEGLNQRVKDNAPVFRTTLERLLDLPLVGDVRGAGYFYGIELVKDKQTKETFNDEESERLLRGFLSKALFDAGVYCRADDRGDPVIQLSPPLTMGPAEFDELESRLRSVITEAENYL